MPQYKHGRYSAVLPEGMSRHFATALTDPELLSQRSEIAVVTSRIEQLLADAQAGGGSIEAWRQLDETYKTASHASREAAKAQSEGRTDDAAAHQAEFRAGLVRIGEIIRSGEHANNQISEAVRLFEPRRRLVESERRRVIEGAQLIEIARVAVLIDALAEVIRNNVRDPNTLTTISREFASILGGSPLLPVGSATNRDG